MMKKRIIIAFLLYFSLSTANVAADEAVARPIAFALLSNYPNPFNSSTVISYRLQENGTVRIEINNLFGRPVRRLVDEEQTAGDHRMVWDGRDDRGNEVPAGVYFCIMRFKGQESIQRMILLR